MLRSLNELFGYSIAAVDGDLGKVHDFLFDEILWIARYLVVDTGGWLPGKKVLLVPSSLGEPDWKTQTFPVNLNKEMVENSPEIAEDMPVSRQHEIELHKHYRWIPYWTVGVRVGEVVPPSAAKEEKKEEETDKKEGDPYLRSIREVTGYHIHATDGDIGHVEDFIADVRTWMVRYMVVDTKNWLPGRKVLVAPDWIDRISWPDSKVQVDLSREKIKNSPEFNPSEPINRKYEERLYDFYGRPKYWL
ncbi:MAG: PRC-barrel domain-containing protein [Candidatus Aminicenantes bacterium]|jgi:hypothetical protein